MTKLELNKLARNTKFAHHITENLINNYQVKTGPLTFSYATSGIQNEHLSAFEQLCKEKNIHKKLQQLLNQKKVNQSENRAVNHHLLRQLNQDNFYQNELQRFIRFVKEFDIGQFEHIVQVGIGGSFTGPKLCIEALKPWAITNNCRAVKSIHFISNIDPDQTQSILFDLNLKKTLFIVASKSGSTQETIANIELIKQIAENQKVRNIEQHCIGITCKNSFLEKNYQFSEYFYIDEAIGGRFSTCSVISLCILAFSYGIECINLLLQGAFSVDQDLSKISPKENAALLNACLNIWFRNYCGYQTLGIIPYSGALQCLPQFIQQLSCESLGKQCTTTEKPVTENTSTLVYGEQGSNAQHAFFQMAHQGTSILPLQFIAFKESNFSKALNGSNQHILNSNLAAQISSLVQGKSHTSLNKTFFGNRPSTLIIAEKLTPHTLGALIAFYENSVMFESFLLNINAFDQEGVELGKALTKALLENKADQITTSFYNLL